MYENSDKFVLNRKSRFSHFEICCSYTFIKKPERHMNFSGLPERLKEQTLCIKMVPNHQLDREDFKKYND
jgi:hypothetical protein